MKAKPIAALAVCAATLVIAPTPAQADPAALAGLEKFMDGTIEAKLSDLKIPGATVTVVSDGEQIFSKGYGVSNVDEKTPVDPAGTGFGTGSVSKVFIAQAALQQVEAGKLDLDADVNKYLSFDVEDTYPNQPVTMRHLLTHTGGFDENLVGKSDTDASMIPPLGQWLEENQPPRVRPPGTVVSYDNYGTALASYVVEQVSKQEYADYVGEHILTPAGMTDTSVDRPLPEPILKNLAQGYRADGRTPAPLMYSGMTPSGVGPATTSEDMGRWMISQMRGGDSTDATIAAEMAEIQYQQDKRIPGGMGFLYEVYERDGLRLVNKGGDIDGFHSMLSMIPDKETGIYVAFNGDGTAGGATTASLDVTNAFADRYFPGDQEKTTSIGGDVSKFSGTYGTSRTSQSSLMGALTMLSGAATVEATGDGEITTTGLGIEPGKRQKWHQIEPGVFAAKGEAARIAFDGKGNLASSEVPVMTFQKLSWDENPRLHLALLLIGVLTAAAGLLVFPMMALARRLRKRQAHPPAARYARLFAILNGLLVLASLTGFSILLSDTSNILAPSVPLTVVPVLAAVAALTSLGLMVFAVGAWWKRWWGVLARGCYSAMALGGVAFAAVTINYHLTAMS